MKSSVGVMFLLLSVVVTASALNIGEWENLDLDERELETQQADKLAALLNKPSIGKRSWCVRACIGWSWLGLCLKWGTRCRRSEIPDQPEQLPSNEVESDGALSQRENIPVDKIAVGTSGRACTLCPTKWVSKFCPICLNWDNKRSLDATEPIAVNDVVMVSSEEQKTAVATLEEMSQMTFRNLYGEKVVKAERYEFPAKFLGKGVTTENTVDGVIVTLADESRFVVINGLELWKGKSSAILKADVMADIWTKVESKDVQSSKVADYVNAADSSTSSKEAADKMMALE